MLGQTKIDDGRWITGGSGEDATAAATTGYCKLIVASFRIKPILLTCCAKVLLV
jgi:hypothetical protein